MLPGLPRTSRLSSSSSPRCCRWLSFVLILLASAGCGRLLRPLPRRPGLGRAALSTSSAATSPAAAPAYVATGAIGLAFVFSLTGFVASLPRQRRITSARRTHRLELATSWPTPDTRPAESRRRRADKQKTTRSRRSRTTRKLAKPHDESRPGDADAAGTHWTGRLDWLRIRPGRADRRPARGTVLQLGFRIDSLDGPHVPDGDVHRHADPSFLDRLHERRAAAETVEDHQVHTDARPSAAPRPVRPVLHVPVAVLLLDAQPGPGRQPVPGVRELGAGRHLLVSAGRLLLRAAKRLQRGQQGVHHQPRRRRRLHHRPADPLDLRRHVQLQGHLPRRSARRCTTRTASLVLGGQIVRGEVRRTAGRVAMLRAPDRPVEPAATVVLFPREQTGRFPRRRAARSGPWTGTDPNVPIAANPKPHDYSYDAVLDAGRWPAWASSSAASASRRSSRCTSGCPTRWKARRRSAP